MRKELSVVVFSLIAAAIIPVMSAAAQQTAPQKTEAQIVAEAEVTAGRQGDVKAAIKDQTLKIQQQTAGFSAVKKAVVDELNYQLISATSNYVDYSLDVLGRMEIILVRAKIKVEAAVTSGKSVGNSQSLLTTAQAAIDSARSLVVSQSKAVYVFDAGNEANLKSEARRARGVLLSDLQKVRIAVIGARKAVAAVIVEFNQSQAVSAQ